jgi:hypothetical protein
VFHCTVSGVLITTTALIAALAAVGSPAWPNETHVSAVVAVVIVATGYTVYSEYMNTSVRKAWANDDCCDHGGGRLPFSECCSLAGDRTTVVEERVRAWSRHTRSFEPVEPEACQLDQLVDRAIKVTAAGKPAP